MNGVAVPELKIDGVLFANREMPAHCKVERRVVANLIAHLEAKGFEVVGVWDGEVFEKAKDAAAAMEFIFNLDEASLRVAPKGKPKAWHGIYLVGGNGVDIVSDWNFSKDDADGFDAAMSSFDAEVFE